MKQDINYNLKDPEKTNFRILQKGKANITSGAGAPGSDLDDDLYVDTTNNRLYVNVNGTWKYTALT